MLKYLRKILGLSLLLLAFQSSAQLTDFSYDRLSRLVVENIAGDKIPVLDTCCSKHLIVLHTGKSCIKCYSDIFRSELLSGCTPSSYSIACLSIAENNAVTRRFIIESMENYLPFNSKYMFLSQKDALFSQLYVDKSPMIIIVDTLNLQLTVYRYGYLFNNGIYNDTIRLCVE